MRKLTTLLLIFALVSSSLLILQSASASSIATPEISLKLNSNPYTIEPTTTTDPYTGETKTVTPSYTSQNTTIEITIKNQAIPSSIDISGNQTGYDDTSQAHFYYNIRYKGHYSDEWTYDGLNLDGGSQSKSCTSVYNASESGETIIELPLGLFPSMGKVDFQVQALFGQVTKQYTGMMAIVPGGWEYNLIFNGQASGWSSTQILTLGETSTVTPTAPPTATPTATTTPTITPSVSPQNLTLNSIQPDTQASVALGFSMEQIVIVGLGVLVAALLSALLISRRKHSAVPST
jgi:hypothetical protein